MYVLCLLVTIVTGDYPSTFLCSTVVEQPQVTFAAMDSHYQEHSFNAVFFCYSSKRKFKIYLPARTIITIYGGTSVIFLVYS